jgi:hypothetical protein
MVFEMVSRKIYEVVNSDMFNKMFRMRECMMDLKSGKKFILEFGYFDSEGWLLCDKEGNEAVYCGDGVYGVGENENMEELSIKEGEDIYDLWNMDSNEVENIYIEYFDKDGNCIRVYNKDC